MKIVSVLAVALFTLMPVSSAQADKVSAPGQVKQEAPMQIVSIHEKVVNGVINLVVETNRESRCDVAYTDFIVPDFNFSKKHTIPLPFARPGITVTVIVVAEVISDPEKDLRSAPYTFEE